MPSWPPQPDPPGHWDEYDQDYLDELTRFDTLNQGHFFFNDSMSTVGVDPGGPDFLEFDNEFAFGRKRGSRGHKPTVTK